MASEDEHIRARLVALDELYADTPKKREPHPDVGCWWTLYDYGIDVVKTWAVDYKHPYPGARLWRTNPLGTALQVLDTSPLDKRTDPALYDFDSLDVVKARARDYQHPTRVRAPRERSEKPGASSLQVA